MLYSLEQLVSLPSDHIRDFNFLLNIKYRYDWEEGNRRKQGELNKNRWMGELRKRHVGKMTHSGSRSNNSRRLNKD